jgi:hypothetical protein
MPDQSITLNEPNSVFIFILKAATPSASSKTSLDGLFSRTRRTFQAEIMVFSALGPIILAHVHAYFHLFNAKNAAYLPA